jgi:hypothetical protein
MGEDFMFELTKSEVFELSRSQFATLNNKRGSNIKYIIIRNLNRIVFQSFFITFEPL